MNECMKLEYNTIPRKRVDGVFSLSMWGMSINKTSLA